MSTFLLSAKDVLSIVHHVGLNRVMDELIERLTNTFNEFDSTTYQMPTRDGFISEAHNGLIEWMPVSRQSQDVVVKIVSYFPENPTRYKMPTIQAQVGLFDGATGRVKVLMDGQLLTALRTGAASAIASRILASDSSLALGLVGCGQQAVTQAHALCRVFPIRKIYAFDICKNAVESLPKRLRFLNLDIVGASLIDVEKHADILCTATSVGVNEGPVISGKELRHHVHINAVGADFPGKRELPVEVVQGSFICPDSYSQALREGESQILSQNDIGPELHQLVKDGDKYQIWKDRTTIFDSTGIAIEDAVATDVLVDFAIELGIGRTMDLCDVSGSPKDTYGLETTEEIGRSIQSMVLAIE